MTHEKNMIEYLDKAEDECAWKFPTAELEKIFRKKNFLKSAPKLGDYVPTNEKGEVMEKPFDFGNWEKAHYPSEKRMKIHEQFQEALDRVMWQGWEVKQSLKKDHYILYHPSDPHIARCCDNKMEWIGDDSNTYEQLITSGVKLERIEKK